MRIAILASGTGTNAQAIIDKVKQGLLNIEIGLIVSNKPGAQVLKRWTPAIVVDHKIYPDRSSYDLAIIELLQRYNCDTVVLAGYMRLLSQEFLQVFRDHVLNIHPALLPAFPGTHGIEDALHYGVKLTGPSVHFVDEKMDGGPLIIQAACPVITGEKPLDLANRIHALEHRIYPQALEWFAEGRLKIQGRQVLLAPGDKKPAHTDGSFLVWPPLEDGF